VLNVRNYENELGTLASNCRSQLSANASFGLDFTQNQANKVAHNLVRTL